MNKHTQDNIRGDKREIMKSPGGRGQKAAGEREIMKGARGRGEKAAGDREVMMPRRKKSN